MTKLFALCDCNNFYASCERVFNPALEGKPVVVLSNNDGCVIARSNEAKAMGIKMGEPFFRVRHLMDQGRLHVFSSNYALYGDMSDRVMQTLAQFTPRLEVYSIDECFMDLGGFIGKDTYTYANEIRQTVRQWTGIPVSLGAAPTKALAKIANRLAKKSAKAKGLLVLTDPYHIRKALEATPIEEVWGIGRRYAVLLQKQGIRTAQDFVQLPDNWVLRHMTVVGLRLLKELRGESCLELEETTPDKKAICTSRSFSTRITTFDTLLEATATYTASCAQKLRKQQSCASLLTVFITTNEFSQKDEQYCNSKTITLPMPTNSTLELVRYANMALAQIYRDGFSYKKSGVIVSGLVPANAVQLPLLHGEQTEKHARLMSAIDDVTKRFGNDTVKVATQGNASYRRKLWTSNSNLSIVGAASSGSVPGQTCSTSAS